MSGAVDRDRTNVETQAEKIVIDAEVAAQKITEDGEERAADTEKEVKYLLRAS